ncbi:hypothetical protein B9G98_00534 [Wickerhamiella sorbophila]|uniref:Uncharacterized protein n=1 Tax=Wickerhamiella sorbophila TaxID=45607 RepID=A0A2T0FD42_9ASCO|nr:hypothetical protein B9G98_00534 [Wickerhamiella sorbophila]PRT52914.1 hypothetical protein B9G98_00534 [Wickerhamiella sorbophila]
MPAKRRVRKKPQTIRAIAAQSKGTMLANEVEAVFEPLELGDNPEFQRIAARFTAQDKDQAPVKFEQETVEEVPSKKRRTKISLATLKEHTGRPELVQLWDADAKDPLFLIQLKSAPGVVQVPPTWQSSFFKSRFYRRPAYRLPQNISDTGIMDLRDVYEDEQETLTQKSRQRVQPKLGKLDVDFRKLHAAFFKFQQKPRLSSFGSVYDPSKQQAADVNFDQFTPGVLSDRLRGALGLGPHDEPPWAKTQEKIGLPTATKHEHWGEMNLDSESEQSESDLEPEQEEQPQPEPEKDDEPKYEPDSESEPELPTESASNRQLYVELQESSTEGALGPSKKYNLP